MNARYCPECEYTLPMPVSACTQCDWTGDADLLNAIEGRNPTNTMPAILENHTVVLAIMNDTLRAAGHDVVPFDVGVTVAAPHGATLEVLVPLAAEEHYRRRVMRAADHNNMATMRVVSARIV